MKKVVLIGLLIFFLASPVLADCDINVSLLNQDPYPAVPGDYVKLVFQVTGRDNPECGDFSFQLLEEYPLKFDKGENGYRHFERISYIKDYTMNTLIPFKVRVDEAAADGTNQIKVWYKEGNTARVLKDFDFEVRDVRAKFDIYVKDYDINTHELTLEVLNYGKADIEAVTVEIPKQDNIIVKGPNKAIIGDLDSNDYTTASFEAIPKDGRIKLKVWYSDEADIRRSANVSFVFDSNSFMGRARDKKGVSFWVYFLVVVVVGFAVWKFFKRKKG